jgi:hypothetical protein
MSKRVLATGFALMLIMLSFSVTSAQTPFVAVYFDHAFQTEASPVAPNPCPGIGVLDTLYIAATNFNAFLSGIEFQVHYPPSLIWITDFDTPPTVAVPGATFGNTPTGISVGWANPQNGFFTVEICKVLVQWNCDDCDVTDQPIIVTGHPLFVPAIPRATDFPNFQFINGVGLTSLICVTVPVEESTWGKVKSLYQD